MTKTGPEMAEHTNHNDALVELAAMGYANSHSTIDLELATKGKVQTVTLYESLETEDADGQPVISRGKVIARASGPFYVDALNALIEKVK